MVKNFAITGVAGYIAPRHLKAISETKNRLVAAVDPHDSVGILDRFFLDVAYFREFERFDRHIEKLRRKSENEQVHYVSICSPNYLHDAHIRFALRVGAHAICEKPLVLNPWNADALIELEQQSQHRVFTVLQLRHHEAILGLKKRISETLATRRDKHSIKLDYITSRGQWYLYSWKGNEEQSGGLVTNIGIHFFDMLIWVFGGVQDVHVYERSARRVSGVLELEHAYVRWRLSIAQEDLPEHVRASGGSTHRSITVDDQELEFSQGFTDLHTSVYKDIQLGTAPGILDALPSIELVHRIRTERVEADSEQKGW